MKRLVLGTAGHVDHGKTALVGELTGTDTDRLEEEKERGITIELGFAELALPEVRYGVVDVPGHEAFVKAMVAGAAGTDVVLLAVAVDEGVMPQTREHVAIVEALGARSMVVALTKCDAADDESVEIVEMEIDDLLEGTPFGGSPRVRTSARTGLGLEKLRTELARAAQDHGIGLEDDLVRLPVDRVFSAAGAGTIVTGTVWSGRFARGDRVRLLPAGRRARIRSIQTHGRDTDAARRGERAAVALVGEGADRSVTARGSTLVADPAWRPGWMLTVRASVFPDSELVLEHNQRVRVHLATSEVLARVALLEEVEGVLPGGSGWIQLRLEAPVAARARDRLVLRRYSPVTSIAGAVVAEPLAAKRTRISHAETVLLGAVVEGDVEKAVDAVLTMAGWSGVELSDLPLLTGLAPAATRSALPDGSLTCRGLVFAREIVESGRRRLLACVDEAHEDDPVAAAVPSARVRDALPRWVPGVLADGLMDRLLAEGSVEKTEGGLRRAGRRPAPSKEQASAIEELTRFFRRNGLAPRSPEELPDTLRDRPDIWSLTRFLVLDGRLSGIGDGLFVDRSALERAITEIRTGLGGGRGLGPTDFRKYLPVSRKRLLPILNHLDSLGVTLKEAGGRSVEAKAAYRGR